MKKGILLFSAIALMAFSGSYAQEASKKAVKSKKVTTTKTVTKMDAPKVVEAKVVAPAKVGGAGMVFEQETIDYGTIQHNADGKREFVFTNNGTEPLVISNTQGSCGCTVPTTPKEPIAPGGKGIIGVKYATDRVGPFTKTVTVTSNAEGMPSKVLTIKGTVLPDPASVVTTPVTPAGPTATPASKS